VASAQERAKVLAQELKKTLLLAKAAEAKAKQLSDELVHVLAEVRVEAEAARTVVEYPAGRYECAACRNGTIFTSPLQQLPACDNCGHQKWSGHEPTVTTITPPAPHKYLAGMYRCAGCGAHTAITTATDELSPCEICGVADVKPL
jgi:DNA-directed RNA polymerase subunit RPC12/RpoP